jgi:hypothetical protein
VRPPDSSTIARLLGDGPDLEPALWAMIEAEVVRDLTRYLHRCKSSTGEAAEWW